jgi:hypothetical protein
MWAFAAALLAILPAVALLRAERAERRQSALDQANYAQGSTEKSRLQADDKPAAPLQHPSQIAST